MQESLNLVELGYPREQSWRINLYRGYLSICHPDDPHLTVVERYVEQGGNSTAIKIAFGTLWTNTLVSFTWTLAINSFTWIFLILP